MSSIASSMVANALRSWTCITSNRIRVQEPLDILRQDVGLEIDVVARLEPAERRRPERVLDERDGKALLIELGDRERDALDGDRSLLDQVAEDVRPDVDPDPLALALGLDRAHGTDGVDVPLHVVTAERVPRTQRRLEVHLAAERLGTVERLVHDVEAERPVAHVGNRQTDAVDGDRVTDSGRDAALDDEPAVVERRDPSLLLDDPGEQAWKATATNEERAAVGPLLVMLPSR